MWFVFVKSPLGTSVRVSKMFIMDFNETMDSELKHMIRSPLIFEEVRVEGVEEILRLANIDPDSADLMRLGMRRFLVASYY